VSRLTALLRERKGRGGWHYRAESRYKILTVWAVDVWKAQPEEKRNERFLSISLLNSLIRPPTLQQPTEGKKNHISINKEKNILPHFSRSWRG
jgi:hypothetical protein